MVRRLHGRRRGATMVECAVIFPVFLLLLFGLIVGAFGIFRYHQVAALAREGARYASVHGDAYSFATYRDPATAQDIYTNAIEPRMIGLNPQKLTYSVTWTKDAQGNDDKRQGSMVTVRVDYDWIPGVVFRGVKLSSTSTMEIEY